MCPQFRWAVLPESLWPKFAKLQVQGSSCFVCFEIGLGLWMIGLGP